MQISYFSNLKTRGKTVESQSNRQQRGEGETVTPHCAIYQHQTSPKRPQEDNE